MFSRRTGWDRAANPISAKLEEFRSEGRELLDLTESNPTRVGLHVEPDVLSRALGSAQIAHYDPAPRGLPSAREAVAEVLSQSGPAISSEHLILSASTSEAYSWLFKLLCEPGDDVLIPRPSYPLFEYLTALESVGTRTYPLRFDGQWHFDLSELEASAGPRTRALLVVNPGNPTGGFLEQGQLEGLWALCARRGWALISDEVFSAYGRARPAPANRVLRAALPEAGALTFSLGGLSKYAALPQLKLGWIAVSGPEALRDEALDRLELIADSYLSVNSPVQLALRELLRMATPLQARIRERVEANRVVLERFATRDKAWSLLPSEGGWSATLRIPARCDEDQVCLRLLDAGVVVQPGYYFDFPDGRWLVLSLLPEKPVFLEATSRVSATLDGLTDA